MAAVVNALQKVNRDWFYKLASDLEQERLSAAIGLINELSNIDTEENGRKEWVYVMDRLVKGLASSRGSARLGYSLCLTELVSLALEKDVYESIYVFLQQLDETLGRENGAKNGKEERGFLFGRLFALQTLLNEPVFSKTFLQNGSTSGVNLSFTLNYIEILIDLALSKTWLREPCLFTVYQVIEKLLPNLTDDPELIAIIQLLDEKKVTLTNEGLSIYLLFLKNRRALPSISLKNPGWKNNDPLSKGNVQLLASVLKDVVPIDGSDLKQKGTWSPRLHYVWDILLPLLNENSSMVESDTHVLKKRKKNTQYHERAKDNNERIQYPEFWQAVVDESFFNEKSSNERKYLGFMILDRAVQICSSEYVHVLLSQNLIRCLINQSQDSKRMLYKISTKALQTIVTECDKTPEKVVSIVDSLWFGANGSINFDKLVKNKVVDTLIMTSSLNLQELSKLVSLLISKLPKNLDKDVNLTRFIFDAFLHIVRAHKTVANVGWVTPLLCEIVKAAFFMKSDDNKLDEMSRDRLYSILGELITSPNKPNEVESWPYITLAIIFDYEKTGSGVSVKLDETLEDVKSLSVKTLDKIHSRNYDDKSPLVGLELLFSMSLIQLYAGDEESVSILQDLTSFYEDGNDNDLVGITEILLSLVAQRKSLLKRLSLLVWESLVDKIGEPELRVLVETLAARENKQGFSSLFEGGSDGEDDEDREEGEEGEDYEDDDEGDGEADEDSEETDEEEKNGNNDLEMIEKEATSALAKALNLPNNIVGEDGEVHFSNEDGDEDDDDDEDEEAEESMDDEAMMELDDQLSEIFKRRKDALSSIPTGSKRKLEVQESRENVVSFKHRVLDMLEVYVRTVERSTTKDKEFQEKSLSNILCIIIPILKCLKQTLDKPLADKCGKLMKTRISKLKASIFSENSMTNSKILEMLQNIHKMVLSSKPGQFQILYYSSCSLASLFLAKLYVDRGGSYEELIDLYGNTTKLWMKYGRSPVAFFIDFSNWLQTRRNQVTNLTE